MIKLSPSVLACDFSKLGEELAKVEAAGCEYIHLDVMDGIFVPNISFGPCVISSVRDSSKMVFDTHLMITDPIRYIDAFKKAGADIITFHYESCEDHLAVIEKIREVGLKPAISIKPKTPAFVLEGLLKYVDMVLVMSVEPGFGGQAFMPESLNTVRALVEMRERHGLDFEIEIDGGINMSNIADVVEAGVDVVVAGSAIFGADDPAEAVKAFKNA